MVLIMPQAPSSSSSAQLLALVLQDTTLAVSAEALRAARGEEALLSCGAARVGHTLMLGSQVCCRCSPQLCLWQSAR